MKRFVLNYDSFPPLSSLMLMDRWRTEEFPQGRFEFLVFLNHT